MTDPSPTQPPTPTPSPTVTETGARQTGNPATTPPATNSSVASPHASDPATPTRAASDDVEVESLFDRTTCAVGGAYATAVSQPSRRRRSALRSAFTLVLLFGLVSLIAGYVYITDAARVRDLSQRFLTQLSGGDVTVERAALSIFEGLRLDGIRINIRDGNELLFTARTLHVSYNPLALLRGRVEADRILAIEPHIYLVEDVDRKQWNFQRLDRYRGQPAAAGATAPAAGATDEGAEKPKLPELLVRNARIDYGQILAGRRSNVGTLALEGQFTPDAQRLYHFRLQSRGTPVLTAATVAGGGAGIFPIAEGWADTEGGSFGVVLRDVEFVDEIKTIMPAVVRQFWERHGLAGRMGETRVSYFRKPDGRAGFKVETDLDGVRLSVPPSVWAGPRDWDRIARWRTTVGAIASPTLGGSPVARLLVPSMDPDTLQLDEVDGTFIFTDEQIRIDNLIARVENNRFRISGSLGGYTAHAGASLRIESLRTQDIVIPEAPTFIAATPWPVQEIYYRFRPRGTAGFWVQLDRPAGAQSHPTLAGEITVKQASFVFERFAYPVDRATGSIRFGNDPATGRELLEIRSIKGYGYKGGPNENAQMEVSGWISPLDETAAANIRVTGRDIVGEPLLIDAMPPPTRKSVRNFDPDGTGKLPAFRGDFDCEVIRPRGQRQPWMVTTSLDIKQASGALAAFPYPMRDVTAQMTIYEDYLELTRALLKRPDGGQVELSGVIDWTTRDQVTRKPIVQPVLRLKASGVAIDDELMAALPEQKRAWLQRVGLKGLLDIDGRITATGPAAEEMAVEMTATLRKGSAVLPQSGATITDITAVANIGATSARVSSVTARRGKARIEGQANIDWRSGEPVATAAIRVTALDIADLVALMPPERRAAIESLRAAGTVDVAVDVVGDGQSATLKPNRLSIKPHKLPLPMTELTGEIKLEGDRVTLRDLTARVEKGTLAASGTVDKRTGALSLALAGRDVQITPAVRAALPPTLAKFANSIELGGAVSFDVPKLVVGETIDLNRSPGAAGTRTAQFDGALWLQKTSMSLGAPVKDATGVIRLNGVVVGERLASLDGTIAIDHLEIAGRNVSNLTATVLKPGDRELLRVAKIEGRIADGSVAGQLDTMIAPDDSRFGVQLVLRNARVTDLTGELEKPIEGRLTASLAMEGDWKNPKASQGRGDVLVEGREMYRVPLLFGVMQIANLSLPLEAPINQAGIRYVIEGPKLTLEQIDLRSKTAAMQGSGSIDFDTRQVQMTLGVSNTAADSVPIFGDLIRGARQDLLQVKVKGTLQEPKVQARAFNMFSTTVDEIVKGK